MIRLKIKSSNSFMTRWFHKILWPMKLGNASSETNLLRISWDMIMSSGKSYNFCMKKKKSQNKLHCHSLNNFWNAKLTNPKTTLFLVSWFFLQIASSLKSPPKKEDLIKKFRPSLWSIINVFSLGWVQITQMKSLLRKIFCFCPFSVLENQLSTVFGKKWTEEFKFLRRQSKSQS